MHSSTRCNVHFACFGDIPLANALLPSTSKSAASPETHARCPEFSFQQPRKRRAVLLNPRPPQRSTRPPVSIKFCKIVRRLAGHRQDGGEDALGFAAARRLVLRRRARRPGCGEGDGGGGAAQRQRGEQRG
eukprot:6179207-Pleurochrysis_carterae.AAC.2